MSQQNRTAAANNTGRAVVHVRQDSDHALEDMFRVLTQPQGAYVPLRERQLPESFFKPPNRSGNHSRESSADSTSYLQAAGAGGLPIPHHSKSFSSPASLQETLSVAPSPAASTPIHPRQQSFDITLTEEVPLPPGWEMATTPKGERYFLNHNTQTTTWQDPRKSLSSTSINNQQQPPPNLLQSPDSPQQQQQQQQQSPNNNSVLSQPLPPGWEQAFNPEGEMYFINHLERTTSWFDPRLSATNRLQQPVAAKLSQIQSQLSQNQQIRRAGILNKQQEAKFQQKFQQLQRDKEMLARKQKEIREQNPGVNPMNSGCLGYGVVAGPSSSGVATGCSGSSATMTPVNELDRFWFSHELRLLSTMGEDAPVSGKPTSQATEIQSVSTSGVDPFLSQTGTSGDHNRQNSADSGLGGMGTSYSLPRTPEDFLSNVDEMDSTELGHKIQSPHSDFGLDSVQGTSMDMGNLADPEASNNAMDSDDLMPSLQEEISSEFLNDVEKVLNMPRGPNLLTWL